MSRAGRSPDPARRSALALLLAAGAAATLPRTAEAHRAHVTLSRLARSSDGRRWEIEHHLHRHDAEHALQRLTPGQRFALASPEGRAHIALHVEDAFRLRHPSGEPLPLTMVGADFGSDSMVVYQDCAAPAAAGRYQVSARLFQRFFDAQQNHVSVQLGTAPVLIELDARRSEAGFDVG